MNITDEEMECNEYDPLSLVSHLNQCNNEFKISIDEFDSRPLLDNMDNDPDFNLFSNLTIDVSYFTPSMLGAKLSNIASSLSVIHINARSLLYNKRKSLTC